VAGCEDYNGEMAARGSHLEPEMAVELAGIKLPNPTILASGILGVSSEIMVRACRAGAGAVVTKSFNRKGREGYHNPSFIEVPGGFLNALGIPNPGMEEMREEVRSVSKAGVPVIASVFGFDGEEFAEAALQGEEGGAIAVELNVSCPHVKEVGVEIGQRPDMVAEVTKAVKNRIRVPVFVKLTPNVASIQDIARAAESAGADGITAINTALGMAIDIDAGAPILGGVVGGLSGPALHSIAVRSVYQVSEAVKIPVIGVGGITDWKGGVEMMMAGASAIQVGTAVMYRGVDVFREITAGMSKFLRDNHYSSVREIVGSAHKGATVPA
jgi:dihydroorotate dehydrogenase (NAD+) catalytic subunit